MFLECNTYRLCGHVGPDDNVFGEHKDIRPPKEVERWAKFDPLSGITKIADDETIAGWFDETLMEVNEAREFAENSAWPEPEDLEKYVYAEIC